VTEGQSYVSEVAPRIDGFASYRFEDYSTFLEFSSSCSLPLFCCVIIFMAAEAAAAAAAAAAASVTEADERPYAR